MYDSPNNGFVIMMLAVGIVYYALFAEGRAYCFATVCLSVGPPTDPFIFFADVVHTEMKFSIQIYHNNI